MQDPTPRELAGIALDWVLEGNEGQLHGLQLALRGETVHARGRAELLEALQLACLERRLLLRQRIEAGQAPTRSVSLVADPISELAFVARCLCCDAPLTRPCQLLSSELAPEHLPLFLDYRGYPPAFLPEGLAWYLSEAVLQRLQPHEHAGWEEAMRSGACWRALSPGDHLIALGSLGEGVLWQVDAADEGCCNTLAFHPDTCLRCACGAVIGRGWSDCSCPGHVHLTAARWAPAGRPTRRLLVIGQPPIRDRRGLITALGTHDLRQLEADGLLWLHVDQSRRHLPDLPAIWQQLERYVEIHRNTAESELYAFVHHSAFSPYDPTTYDPTIAPGERPAPPSASP